MRALKLIPTLLVSVIFLAACASPGLIPATAQTSQPAPLVTVAAAPTETPQLVLDTPALTMTETPSGPDTPTEPAAAPDVTLADTGKTIHLMVGQRFLLNLGEGFDWTVNIDDQAIVSRVPNLMPIRGAQGIYEARSAGKTTLTAEGDPTCLKDTPACKAPSILFTVTLVVQ